MTAIIEARGLTKRYKDVAAVDNIDFSIEAEECLGFLGPNGAGKTTIIKLISCVSPLTSGELTVDHKDVTRDGRQIKALLGVVPQENNLDPDLTVWQNLVIYARYFDIPSIVAEPRIKESLSLFQLMEKKDANIRSLSGGMVRRLLIVRGLINQPRVLILDEPTTGLDPQARHLVWQKLQYLKGQGVTMIISTHNMDEAAHLCDRLIIMHHGKILVQGTPAALLREYAGGEVLELQPTFEQKDSILAQLKQYPVTIEEVEGTLYVYGRDDAQLPRHFGPVPALRRQATLEDVFLRLTGRGLVE